MDTDCADQSIMRSKIVLVDSDGLQDAKLQFARIHSVYIYSLSPSVFRDAYLVCEPTASVRDIDAKGNPALNGKIIGTHIKARRGPPKNTSAASSSKTTLDAHKPVVAQSTILPRKSEQVAEKVKHDGPKDNDYAKSLAGTKEPPKPTGKLDWSKAKAKEQETTSGVHGKDKTKPQPNQETKASPSSAKLIDKPPRNRGFGPQSKMSAPKPAVPELKRVPKRKSPDPSDSDVNVEDQPTLKNQRAAPPATSNARVKNGVIMSDDEDEEIPRKPRRNKTSNSERSLEAMMDIDDGPLMTERIHPCAD
ncbi:hypothetical protein AZE42_09897 [Rhizopogon vesiculosus]|uniref:Uncharacterized protein n=1 Tax=Rhizopogon vesiculosus TaxID=180088 RepID=A0A1J8QQZ2_9AGAM|nr:hypothetical protein AZE42_09897 [Rhizopogon vesiculosus]